MIHSAVLCDPLKSTQVFLMVLLAEKQLRSCCCKWTAKKSQKESLESFLVLTILFYFVDGKCCFIDFKWFIPLCHPLESTRAFFMVLLAEKRAPKLLLQLNWQNSQKESLEFALFSPTTVFLFSSCAATTPSPCRTNMHLLLLPSCFFRYIILHKNASLVYCFMDGLDYSRTN